MKTMFRQVTAFMMALMLFCVALAVQAATSERFLERLSSESRDDGTLVVTVHLVERMQYLSHMPAGQGDYIEIRLRSLPPVASLAQAAADDGLRRLVPDQLPEIRVIEARGELDSDPTVLVLLDSVRQFDVRTGGNDRSIEIHILSADEATDMAMVSDEPAAMGALFRQARAARNAGEYQRASAIYDSIIASGIEPYVRKAIVALGMLLAERGQDALAQDLYQRYLQDYPQGPESRRVKRMLLALQQAGDGVDKAAVVDEVPWQVFGSFDQFYLYDDVKLDGAASETYRSSLLNTANINWQGRAGDVDVSGRFLGTYDYSFLDDEDDDGRVSYAYLDLAGIEGTHRGRIGRQRLPGSGILGYFDGLHYQYRVDDEHAVRYVVGSPMYSTREGVDSDRLFNGLAVDFNSADQRWFVSPYLLYQTFDGDTDRRALGAESRFSGERVTAFSLLDYDTYFDELNIFYLFGNWRIQDGTVASLTLDYRRSPGLATSNALTGTGVDGFDDLDPALTEDEIRLLAKDRSLLSRSLYASLTQQLSARWQLLLDGGVYSLRDDSDVTDDLNLDSDDWYLHTQLMGNGLFRSGDMYAAGLRYTEAERMDINTLMLRARLPVGQRWRLSPRLRFDLRQRDNGDDQRIVLPSMLATYQVGRNTSLELDAGVEFSQTDRDFADAQDDRFTYLRAGYRYDF